MDDNDIQIDDQITNIQADDQNDLVSDTSELQVQYLQQDLQTIQPMTEQQPHNLQLEILSLQTNGNPQDEF